MNRKKKARSLLDKRVASIVRVKPQLPPARWPFRAVRFFSLRDEGVETVGDLVLSDGQIVAEPADSIALRNILKEPVWVPEGDGGWWFIYSDIQPEEFLKALVKYHGHGSYFWCEAVGMNDDTLVRSRRHERRHTGWLSDEELVSPHSK